MSPSRRLVLFDPGLASGVGHHSDVNGLLLPPLLKRGWNLELWADAAAALDPQLATSLPGLRPLLSDGGYIDPRHWCDLPGSLHQARLLHQQLAGAASGEPIAVWLAHSLLPFQLIALAQLLQRQAPAKVVISLMFAPGEVFSGQPELDLGAQRLAAQLNTRSALAALAVAVARGNHQLLLCAGSHQLIALYTPLCQAAGLAPPQLHPSLVSGDGESFDGASFAAAAAPPRFCCIGAIANPTRAANWPSACWSTCSAIRRYRQPWHVPNGASTPVATNPPPRGKPNCWCGPATISACGCWRGPCPGPRCCRS